MSAASKAATADNPGFSVPTWMHLLGGWVHRKPQTWITLGNLETRLVQDAIDDLRVDRPVYVAGLAPSLEEGVEAARSVLASGAAAGKLDELKGFLG